MRGSEVIMTKKKRGLGSLSTSSDLRIDRIAMLNEAIVHGAYEMKAEDVATRILEDLFLQSIVAQAALTPVGRGKN